RIPRPGDAGWPPRSCARPCWKPASAASRRPRCRPPRWARRSTRDWAIATAGRSRCGSGAGRAAEPGRYDRAMRIDEIIASAEEPAFSFEFFPPKTPERERTLGETPGTLRGLQPDLVAATHGAGRAARPRPRATTKP